jgi:hypothetical protein
MIDPNARRSVRSLAGDIGIPRSAIGKNEKGEKTEGSHYVIEAKTE